MPDPKKKYQELKKYFPNMKPSDTLIAGSSPSSFTAQNMKNQNARWAGYGGFNKTGKSTYNKETGMYTNVASYDKTKFNMNLGSKEIDTPGNFSKKDTNTINTINIGGYDPNNPVKIDIPKVNLEKDSNRMREVLNQEMEKNKGKWGQ